MTVAELIAELLKHPPECSVTFSDKELGGIIATEVTGYAELIEHRLCVLLEPHIRLEGNIICWHCKQIECACK